LLRANSDDVDGCPVRVAKAGNDLVGIVLVEYVLYNIRLSDNADELASDPAVAPLLRPRSCEVASGNESRLAWEAKVVLVFFLLRGLSQMSKKPKKTKTKMENIPLPWLRPVLQEEPEESEEGGELEEPEARWRLLFGLSWVAGEREELYSGRGTVYMLLRTV
jgi:hypothetical protein